MEPREFFENPTTAAQRQYEALRSFFLSNLSAAESAEKFGFSAGYFKKLRLEFSKKLEEEANPFFISPKSGPKKRLTPDKTVDRIVSLRKQNYSITDIRVVLDSEGESLSLDTINNILKSEGFAPLPKRTRRERLDVRLPQKFEPPRSVPFEPADEEFATEINAGPLIFLPVLENLGIVDAIKASAFPQTNDISDVQSVLSFLALKLVGCKRWSHDTGWNMDRALGFFAGLNVLPKSTTLSTWSYRTNRSANRRFLEKLSRIFGTGETENGEFNLDFKAIPHWGDASVLEKNWSGARSKAMKSILSLIVQSPQTGNLSYTNADIRHRDQNDAVLEFVDFWKKGHDLAPKMLIFDSKFTTYKNLNELNKSKDRILFLTLRRRGRKLVEKVKTVSGSAWQTIRVERSGGRFQNIRVNDGPCVLRGYEGEARQIIITDHGRSKPTFLITNDFEADVRKLVKKYSRRWLVEKEIAEQVAFFSLNNPSSSIVVKVDFDLTISLLAHNLYRMLSNHLPGFENCTVPSIHRKFLENGATVKIKGKNVHVCLKKKTHLPILLGVPWLTKTTQLSWMNMTINYSAGTTS